MDKKKVLFVCVHNSGRSQMAEAFFNRLAANKAIAFSAGTQPALKTNPVRVMREAGIDISGRKPKLRILEMMKSAYKVITMGCGVEESCPTAFVPMEDWQLEDPEGQPIERVRQIRDDIKDRVAVLVKELLPGRYV
jgi:arsenate reductase